MPQVRGAPSPPDSLPVQNSDRTCANCSNPLPPDRAPQARYCDPNTAPGCRKQRQNERKRQSREHRKLLPRGAIALPGNRVIFPGEGQGQLPWELPILEREGQVDLACETKYRPHQRRLDEIATRFLQSLRPEQERALLNEARRLSEALR